MWTITSSASISTQSAAGSPSMRTFLPNRSLILSASLTAMDATCRVDRPEAITKRLETYERDTKPLIDHYSQQGALRIVDGVGDLESVLERITRALEG